ncbi:MAG: glycosyltransferase family 2 protein [Candidatus Moraniibacteriota bacterium]
MDTAPLVAIIVLNYNGKDCLSHALGSLQRLDYVAKKIIVVDNNSRDGSFETAKITFPHGVFLKNTANVGFAAGMNVGIREAFRLGAKYIWLFNNDASADASTLTWLVRFCESRGDVGAVSPVITDALGNTWFAVGEISYLRMRAYHDTKVRGSRPYQSEYLSGCALFLPSAVLREGGLLDERYFLYYEDADLSLRIRKSGKKLFVLPTARVAHGEQSEKKSSEKIYYLVLSGLLFFREHTPLHLRPFVWAFSRLRRFKNFLDVVLKREKADMVARAYKEYDRTQHTDS